MTIIKKIKNNKAFVLLFAVTIAALLLSIALGVGNIALKEVKFSTSAKDANNAFFAADTGSEYVFFNDKSGASSYVPPQGQSFTWTKDISQLGSNGISCAKVSVTKDNTNPPSTLTTIISDGYNNGGGVSNLCTPGSSSVERELKTTYGSSNPGVQDVVWKNIVGVNAVGNNLTKTAATGWCDIPSDCGGASSVQSITAGDGDGYVEFSTSENSHGKTTGLGTTDPDQNFLSINFAINTTSIGTINIFEGGFLVGTQNMTTYAPGDVFRIAIKSGKVNYYKNGIWLYTSSAAPVYPLFYDTAFNHIGGTITNAKIFKGSSGNITFGNSARFITTDTTTQGSWHGVYGVDGYNIIGATVKYPSYVTVTPTNNIFYSWADPTGDARGLYKDAVTTTRIADTWFSAPSWSLDFNFNDGNIHQVAIYALDFDNAGRAMTIDVLDGSTSAVLDTRNVTNYGGGKYYVWNLSGHVVMRFTNTAVANAVISGIFFR